MDMVGLVAKRCFCFCAYGQNMIAEKSSGVKKAVVRLMELSNDERTRMLHDSYMRKEWSIQGRERLAREDGEISRAFTIAKNLLDLNLPIDNIVKATGLTHAEITQIKNADFGRV